MGATSIGLLIKADRYERQAQQAIDRDTFELYHQAAVETGKLAKAAASLEASIRPQPRVQARPQPRPRTAAPAARRPAAGALAKSADSGRGIVPGSMIYMHGIAR